MLSDVELSALQNAARGETMDYERWPALIDSVTERLNEIARNEFPIFRSSQPQATDSSRPNHTTSSESADKENADPASSTLPNHSTDSDDVLPREILIRLNSVLKTLTTNFKSHPPHTVQRLAELVIEPRKHYRNLPAYLHALDRVVNVTSGAHIFPLPAAVPSIFTNGSAAGTSNAVSWGNSTTAQPTLGSDESLGGALLTPIPWLINSNTDSIGSGSRSGSRGPIEREVRTESTETIEGPNGAGSIETVTVSVYNSGIPNQIPSENTRSTTVINLRAGGGVTQRELLRQEQHLNLVSTAQITGRLSDAAAKSEDDEVPHARGPEEVGVEDMGPQAAHPPNSDIEGHGIDVEAAVGRRADEEDGDQDKHIDVDVNIINAEEKTQDDTEMVLSQTPKRQAEEDLAPEATKKTRNGEDGDAGEVAVEKQEDEAKEEPMRGDHELLLKEEKKDDVDEDSEMLLDVDVDVAVKGAEEEEGEEGGGERKVGGGVGGSGVDGDDSQVGPDIVDTTTAT